MNVYLEDNSMKRFALGDILTKTVKRYPDKEAIVFREVRLTYAELNNAVNKFADALMKTGVKKGDKVAILSHNCYQYVIFLFAVAKIGAWATPLNFMLKGDEIVYILNNSEAILLVTEDALVDRILEVQAQLTSVKTFCSIDLSGIPCPNGWFNFDDLCSNKYSDKEPEVEINNDDVISLLYTSGTESLPKGVMITHLNWYSLFIVCLSDIGYIHDDVVATDIPLYHVGMMATLFNGIFIGSKFIIHYTVDQQDLLQDAVKEKLTCLIYPTTVFLGLLQMSVADVDEYLSNIFTSVRRCLAFGPRMPKDYAKRWINKIIPQADWIATYGQTETTACGAALHGRDILESYDKNIGGPLGKPHQTVDMRIVDENDKEVPVGKVGEIVLRSPSVMLGYFKNKNKTEEIFRNGWHHTEDLGIKDENGFYYFVDRRKDMVRTGGENVASLEVEAAISTLPEVLEVSVIGLSHPYWQEAVVAVVALKDDANIDEAFIIAYCKKSLAGYKVPKKIIFVKEIPKNETGKILKRELRDIYQDIYYQEG